MPYDNWHLSRPPQAALDCAHAAPDECHERHPEAPVCRQHRGKFQSKAHGKGKRWQARWRDPAGVQQTELCRTETEAKKYENKMRSEVDDGSYINPEGGEVRVGDWVTIWMSGLKFDNPRTMQRYEQRMRLHVIGTPLGKLKLKDVSATTIRDWLAGRRELLEDSTLRLIFSNLQSAFDLAVDDELIRKNPLLSRSVQAVRPKRGSTTAKELTVTWNDSEKIRAELPDRYKTLVDSGRGLGMRQGECFGFGPADIDWSHPDGAMVHIQHQVAHDGPVLVFDNPKGGTEDDPRDRWVELGDAVAEALLEHMEKYPPIEVTLPWRTRDGEPMTKRIFFYGREKKPIQANWFNSYVWKPALAAVGLIKPLDPEKPGRRWEKSRDKMMHALRHLYASMMLDGGVDIYTLADRLGHADPAFTLRNYVHRVAGAGEKVRQAVRSMYGRAA
ncbi:tyrosine-type recombinase/integrase [Streptomyces sp. NPDC058157]|uniref:tyrosine-type recombinase/integrase n=1 Tax=Streptomyces sp. NPDC058157 TaxID=3346360 RepID=UPI0036EA2B2F